MSMWTTEITIKVKHDDMHDAEGLETVLWNIVRKWDFPEVDVTQHLPYNLTPTGVTVIKEGE